MRSRLSVCRAVATAVVFMVVTAAALVAQDRPIIVLDPGHGGPGGEGVVVGGVVEKDLVLRIAFVAAAELVARGYDVRLTRTGDYAVSWDDRRRFAEEAGAALLVMLHTNQNDDAARHGAEIYHTNLDIPASLRAAEAVADALRDAGSVVVVEPRPFPFLQSPTVPTLMIELAFLTNPADRRLLQSDAYPRELGAAFARAADRLRGGVR